MSDKWVYDFSEGSKDMRELLGGKGANVAEMTRVLGADRVPAGFTITTEACVAYMKADQTEPEGMADEVAEALERLQEHTGKRLGDDDDPLLVSVRSGARESMPGMLDTVLNLGMNDRSVEGLAKATENDRFAWDSYRRFLQMFGNVSRGIDGEAFEQAIADVKADRGVEEDTDLDTDALKALVDRFKALYKEHTDEEFPQDPQEQLRLAIRAVFDSWTGDRAKEYRRINRIPDDWGTAVNVQQMVFGNKGDTSGSGVAFSRDEVTGAPEPSGDFLPNAQGEDVVSGARTPRDIAEMKEWLPDAYEQLMDILKTLEQHYGDMQDTEFTVEEGQLYMLQTRDAKRPAQAAVRFARDAVDEGLLEREQALMTVDAEMLTALLVKTFDPGANYEVIATGVPAAPGGAKGEVVFTARDAIDAAAEGRDVVLVRPDTNANDVGGFHAAKGILTSLGGKASHAALVARGMGVPCVTAASELKINLEDKCIRVGERTIGEGDFIAINGTNGEVTLDDVPLVDPTEDPAFDEILKAFETVLGWADDVRRLGVRTNADTPADARKARELGAEGIGLCRTEHMFMAEDRQPKMRRMIMSGTRDARKEALAELLPLQQEDFEGLFEAMKGLPVTIRLLDPPLHEFLPNLPDLAAHVERARIEVSADLDELETLLETTERISEENPMLGTRGCRLGILYPEIYEMQVHAIMRAAKAMDEPPHPEIMIPLVDYEHEIELMRELVVRIGDEEGLHEIEDYTVGTMIELPRACFVADRIAKFADFFSFGTNDLTQTALGFSRDDVESKFVPVYMERKIIERSPFETIDKPGVGWLVRLAAWVGRESRPDLKLGICGEHGGDPDSIEFFHMAGLDYVSCSPFRVPIARVAAAQAAIIHANDRSWADA
ncbi:pyruvate, phosphate dikinase [Solirubrobacter sp. CPCC 204708]|uniref:Pyruvate, phosphate dikinase n=1 Tax=Solirubrobacter deserti TaxID=2282478 RepID=A0ABT4RPS8_9ACTN|nr:pyruvate, phosphate dikinase [Solirubrobacter deserti]MBE2316651.1 pyruvate, phosphate dikinase [Solirubrobacter deserti]MDA0140549.1 pyruvate, phosphate dikinase [Solirubrobacter deserti]